ncbi:MAG: LamG domain-containing protein [Pigmentiphaga sp.]
MALEFVDNTIIQNVSTGYTHDYTGEEFTVAFWFMPQETPVDVRYVIHHRSTGGSAAGWEIRMTTSRELWFFLLNGGVDVGNITSSPLTLDTLYHVVCRYKGGFLDIFVNGAADPTPVAATDAGDPGFYSLQLHEMQAGDFTIGDFRLYIAGLSDDDIATLAEGGGYDGVSREALAVWLPLDEKGDGDAAVNNEWALNFGNFSYPSTIYGTPTYVALPIAPSVRPRALLL